MELNRGAKLGGCGCATFIVSAPVAAFGAYGVFQEVPGSTAVRAAMAAWLVGTPAAAFSFLAAFIGGIWALWLSRRATTGAAVGVGFPWPILTGCASLFFVVPMVFSLIFAAGTNHELQMAQSNGDERAIASAEQGLINEGLCCVTFALMILISLGASAGLLYRADARRADASRGSGPRD